MKRSRPSSVVALLSCALAAGCGSGHDTANTTPETTTSPNETSSVNPIDQACASANPALAKMQQVFADLSKVTNNGEAAEIAVSAAKQGERLLVSIAKVSVDYNDADPTGPDFGLVASFATATEREAGALEGVAGALSVGLQAHKPGSTSLAELAASDIRSAAHEAVTRKHVAQQLRLPDCAE